MKNIYSVFLFSLSIFILSSCSNDNVKKIDDIQNIHKLLINETLLNTKIKYSDIFKNAKLIQLDTIREAIYSRISSIKIVHDTIYIFDRNNSRSIYVFTLKGNFIGKISKIGRGPGEYIHPVDFDINENNGDVYIFDWTTKNLIIYNKIGNMKEEIKLNGRYTSFTVFQNNVYCLNSFPVKPEEYMLRCYSLNGDPIFSALKAKDVTDGTLRFRFGNNFYKCDDHIRFFISGKNIVYSYNYNNDNISTFLSLQLSKGLVKDNEVVPFIYGYSENKEYAFFKTEIKNIPYDVFFNFKKSEILLVSLTVMDDITNLPVKLLGIFGDNVVGVVEAQNIPYIKSLIAKGEIDLPMLTDYVNNYKTDILVLYKFK